MPKKKNGLRAAAAVLLAREVAGHPAVAVGLIAAVGDRPAGRRLLREIAAVIVVAAVVTVVAAVVTVVIVVIVVIVVTAEEDATSATTGAVAAAIADVVTREAQARAAADGAADVEPAAAAKAATDLRAAASTTTLMILTTRPPASASGLRFGLGDAWAGGGPPGGLGCGRRWFALGQTRSANLPRSQPPAVVGRGKRAYPRRRAGANH
ncbi:MAG: hypothetical protein R6X02_28985 [Enhygromyxa sp.]